jgi:hypothetical protein
MMVFPAVVSLLARLKRLLVPAMQREPMKMVRLNRSLWPVAFMKEKMMAAEIRFLAELMARACQGMIL